MDFYVLSSELITIIDNAVIQLDDPERKSLQRVILDAGYMLKRMWIRLYINIHPNDNNDLMARFADAFTSTIVTPVVLEDGSDYIPGTMDQAIRDVGSMKVQLNRLLTDLLSDEPEADKLSSFLDIGKMYDYYLLLACTESLYSGVDLYRAVHQAEMNFAVQLGHHFHVDIHLPV